MRASTIGGIMSDASQTEEIERARPGSCCTSLDRARLWDRDAELPEYEPPLRAQDAGEDLRRPQDDAGRDLDRALPAERARGAKGEGAPLPPPERDGRLLQERHRGNGPHRGAVEARQAEEGAAQGRRLEQTMKTYFCECGDHAFAYARTQPVVILVNAADEPFLSERAWTAIRHRRWFRAIAVINGRCRRLHQLLIGSYQDHKNRNALDNRRENLRPVTHSINAQNAIPRLNKSSQYHGVSREKWSGKWMAQIGINKSKKNLGRYSIEEDAARAYDRAAAELYGPNAYLNFP